MTTAGARPAGIEDEAAAAVAVRQMFDSIAPRYDLLNHLLSSNIDRLWWRRTARQFADVLARPDAAVLDVCCGTGDMTMAMLGLRPKDARPILAIDFARNMLARGAQKFAGLGAIAIEADALRLPISSQSVDLIVTAFGFRNLANYQAGLEEFHRVLKPGGHLGILEFGTPGGLAGKAYAFYFLRILPVVGALVCGKREPYNYLPNSVDNFPRPPELLAQMRTAGFDRCVWQPYTFGVAGLYSAVRGPVA